MIFILSHVLLIRKTPLVVLVGAALKGLFRRATIVVDLQTRQLPFIFLQRQLPLIFLQRQLPLIFLLHQLPLMFLLRQLPLIFLLHQLPLMFLLRRRRHRLPLLFLFHLPLLSLNPVLHPQLCLPRKLLLQHHRRFLHRVAPHPAQRINPVHSVSNLAEVHPLFPSAISP
jgi:hypothetical protein